MKFKPTLNDEGYIESLTQTGTSEDTLEVNLEETREHPLFCFKPINNVAVYDDECYQAYLQKIKDEEEIKELKQKLLDTDYIWNAIREGAHDESYYAETIANRKAWRERIQELQNEI